MFLQVCKELLNIKLLLRQQQSQWLQLASMLVMVGLLKKFDTSPAIKQVTFSVPDMLLHNLWEHQGGCTQRVVKQKLAAWHVRLAQKHEWNRLHSLWRLL